MNVVKTSYKNSAKSSNGSEEKENVKRPLLQRLRSRNEKSMEREEKSL